MKWLTDIKQKILREGKNLMLFAVLLLLCGCGEDCPTIQDYISAGSGESCIICIIFGAVADAAVKAAEASWGAMAEPLGVVVVIVSAVYIAIYTLKQVSSVGKQNVADYLTGDKNGVLTLLFKMIIIFILLDGQPYGGNQWFIKYILSPVLQAGIDIGNTVSSLGGKVDIRPSATFGAETSGWQATFDMIADAVQEFNDNVYRMVALGQSMICNATHGGILSWYYLMLLYGFIYFIFGWMMVAAAGLYMIDVGITLAIAAVLLPVGIACAISDKSITYTKNLWNMFLTVFFSFIILGIIVSLSLEMVFHCAGESETPDISGQTFNLQAALDANDAKTVAEHLWSSGSLLLTILCFALIVQLMEQMKGLAEKLSDVTGFSPASQVGGDVAKHPIQGAKKAASWAGNATFGRLARSAGKSKPASWMRRKYTTFRGRVFGVGPEGYKFWLRRR